MLCVDSSTGSMIDGSSFSGLLTSRSATPHWLGWERSHQVTWIGSSLKPADVIGRREDKRRELIICIAYFDPQ